MLTWQRFRASYSLTECSYSIIATTRAARRAARRTDIPHRPVTGRNTMIVTTTQNVDGYRINGYYGIVFGEVITGVNFLRDFGAGIRNIVGGRSAGYENELAQARTDALRELEQRAAAMGAHAVVGVDIDYEVLGETSNMLMVTASGTAVTLEPLQ